MTDSADFFPPGLAAFIDDIRASDPGTRRRIAALNVCATYMRQWSVYDAASASAFEKWLRSFDEFQLVPYLDPNDWFGELETAIANDSCGAIMKLCIHGADGMSRWTEYVTRYFWSILRRGLDHQKLSSVLCALWATSHMRLLAGDDAWKRDACAGVDNLRPSTRIGTFQYLGTILVFLISLVRGNDDRAVLRHRHDTPHIMGLPRMSIGEYRCKVGLYLMMKLSEDWSCTDGETCAFVQKIWSDKYIREAFTAPFVSSKRTLIKAIDACLSRTKYATAKWMRDSAVEKLRNPNKLAEQLPREAIPEIDEDALKNFLAALTSIDIPLNTYVPQEAQ